MFICLYCTKEFLDDEIKKVCQHLNKRHGISYPMIPGRYMRLESRQQDSHRKEADLMLQTNYKACQRFGQPTEWKLTNQIDHSD